MVYHVADTAILTADEFEAHPAANEHNELVRGRIRMMTPASGLHGLVSGNVFRLLSNHVRQHRLGACFADSTGYTLPSLQNTVRAPDSSFVRADRLPPGAIGGGFLKLAPDLAVEVLSPSESASDLCEKLEDYLKAGTLLVWVIDPAKRIVSVFAAHAPALWLRVGDKLLGGEVVPGFACGVAELFEGLDPSPL